MYLLTCFGLGIEDGRTESPLLSVAQWDTLLSRTGFTAIDICLRDYPAEDEWTASVLVSSAVEQAQAPEMREVEIVNDRIDEDDLVLTAKLLQNTMEAQPTETVTLKTAIFTNKVCIFLSEMSRPVINLCSGTQFDQIQKMLKTAAGVIWVTRGGTMGCDVPETGLITGLSRSARSENWGMRLITLDLDTVTRLPPSSIAKLIYRIYKLAFITTAKDRSVEFEYAERNGQLLIPRLVENYNASHHVKMITTVSDPETQPFFQDDRRLYLRPETPGLLDSLRWVDDSPFPKPLSAEEIQVDLRAAGINFHDVMVCLGQLPGTTLRYGEFSGIITAVGIAMAHKYKIGDRVCGYGGKAYANTMRMRGLHAHLIPDGMSFETAASIPVVYATSYHALVNVARLQKGESILIHSAAGGVGQASIMLAQHIGAVIYVTVGNENKKAMIMESFGLPEDRIFSSHSTGFAEGVRRLTSGKGIDVVLNSLAGEALRETWNCISPFGRFIELGKVDILSNSRLDMAIFKNNVTFSAIDLELFPENCPELLQRLLEKAFDLIRKGAVSEVRPISVLPLSEIETAFRQILAGKHMGKIVLKAEPDCRVKVAQN